MTTRTERHQLRLDTLRQLDNEPLFDLDQAHPDELEQHPYTLSDESMGLWYALSYLVSGDHPLSDEELSAIVTRISDLPRNWRNAIYAGAPRTADAPTLILSRRRSATPVQSNVLGENPDIDSEDFVAHVAATTLARPDSLHVLRDDRGLAIELLRPRRAKGLRLALQCWAVDGKSVLTSEVFFEPDDEANVLLAIVPDTPSRRVFALVVEHPN